MTVLYSYGGGDRLATLVGEETLRLEPEGSAAPLVIRHAYLGRVPDPQTGWLVAACLGLFMTFYAVGPGVVVWLTLSELMPTRIRSAGMGIALLLNQGVSTLVAGDFSSGGGAPGVLCDVFDLGRVHAALLPDGGVFSAGDEGQNAGGD